MKKGRILALLLVAVMMFSLTGCGAIIDVIEKVQEGVEQNEDKTPIEIPVDVPVETPPVEDIGNQSGSSTNETETPVETPSGDTFLTKIYDESGKSAEDVALAFLRYVRNKEWGNIVPLLVEGGTPYITAKDIETAFMRNGTLNEKYMSITEQDCLIETDISNYTGECTVYVDLKTTDTNFDNTLFECSVRLVLNENNLWKIDLMREFAKEDWGITVPKGCTLYVDGVEVTKDSVNIINYSKNIDWDVWTFDAIGATEKTFTIKSTVIDSSVTMTPEYNNDVEKVYWPVADTVKTGAHDFVKDFYQKLADASMRGAVTLEFAQQFVGEDAVAGTANNIVAEGKNYALNYSNKPHKDVTVSTIIDRVDKVSYWLTDNDFLMYAGITASYTTNTDTVENMDRYVEISISLKDGKYLIYDCSSYGCLMRLNTTNDF